MKSTLYAVLAIFHPSVEAAREALLDQYSAHLMQTKLPIRLAGPLKDDQGREIGILILIDAESREDVALFVATSPYTKGGLYAHVDINEFDVEVGGFH